MNELQANKINIYACGGAASNIVSDLEPSRKESVKGFATPVACYIDTSRSNFKGKDIPEDSIYLFEGIDGAGKNRDANYGDISKNAKSILQKFKPTTFSLIVHSASGGSGSVIAPVLVSELKERGCEVVVLVIGSTDSKKEIDNTIKTLKSYEAIAIKRGSPVVAYYVENSRNSPRSSVNKQVKSAISLLMGLFSGDNFEMDTADLKTWLNYNKISNTKPCLASLSFAMSEDDIQSGGTVVSVATLALEDMETRLEQTPSYQTVGYPPANWKKGSGSGIDILDEVPLNYCISDDFITKATNKLTTAFKEVDNLFNARVARDSLLTKNDNVQDDGLVL